MARVKVRRSPEITLPEEAWVKLGVAEGEELDIEVVAEGVLLRAVPGAERERAIERMFAAKARVEPTPEQAAKPVEEQEREIFDEVKAMRREHAQSRPR